MFFKDPSSYTSEEIKGFLSDSWAHYYWGEQPPEVILGWIHQGLWTPIEMITKGFHWPRAILNPILKEFPELVTKVVAEIDTLPNASKFIDVISYHPFYEEFPRKISQEEFQLGIEFFINQVPLEVVFKLYQPAMKTFVSDYHKYRLELWMEEAMELKQNQDAPLQMPCFLSDRGVTIQALLNLEEQFPIIRQVLSLDHKLFKKAWKLDKQLVDKGLMHAQLTASDKPVWGMQFAFTEDFLEFLVEESIYTEQEYSEMLKASKRLVQVTAFNPALHDIFNHADPQDIAAFWYAIPYQIRADFLASLSAEKQREVKKELIDHITNELLGGRASYAAKLCSIEEMKEKASILLANPQTLLESAILRKLLPFDSLSAMDFKVMVMLALQLEIPVNEMVWRAALSKIPGIPNEETLFAVVPQITAKLIEKTQLTTDAIPGSFLFYQETLNMLNDAYTLYYKAANGIAVRPLESDVAVLRGYPHTPYKSEDLEVLFTHGYQLPNIHGSELFTFGKGKQGRGWEYTGIYVSSEINASIASTYMYPHRGSEINLEAYILEAVLPSGSVPVCGRLDLFEFISSYIPAKDIIALYKMQPGDTQTIPATVMEVYVNPYQSRLPSYKKGDVVASQYFYMNNHDMVENIRVPYDELVAQYQAVCPLPSYSEALESETAQNVALSMIADLLML